MSMGMAGYQPPPHMVETLQDYYSEILEYYDELFPFDEAQLAFFRSLQQEQGKRISAGTAPLVRFLGIACATGNLENKLSGPGIDITGIDRNAQMVETAKRRMKRGFSTTRFFEMSTLDMARYLKKESFHIIASVDNFLPYIGDETLIRKFFHDARVLLAPGGALVAETFNFDSISPGKVIRLPDQSSLRVTLKRALIPDANDAYFLDASLELGNGRKISLQKGTAVIPLTTEKIERVARESGFSSVSFAGSFSGSPWSPESLKTVVTLS